MQKKECMNEGDGEDGEGIRMDDGNNGEKEINCFIKER